MGNDMLSKLRIEVLALSESERAELALDLVRSLDAPEDSGVAEAWDRELLRRLEQIKNGTAVLLPRDELNKRFQQRLGKS